MKRRKIKQIEMVAEDNITAKYGAPVDRHESDQLLFLFDLSQAGEIINSLTGASCPVCLF